VPDVDESHVMGTTESRERERMKRWVFRRLEKTCRDGADVTWRGRSLHARNKLGRRACVLLTLVIVMRNYADR